MADLPDDVLFQIFAWLPGKQLAALQTLSKRTSSGIRTRKFQELHSTRHNADSGFFAEDMNGEFQLFFLEDCAGVPPSSLKFFKQGRKQIMDGIKFFNQGLVVLVDGINLLLFNPLLGEVLPLGRPRSPFLTVHCAAVLNGESNDIRVVCFADGPFHPRSCVECWVYSTSHKSWAMVTDKIFLQCLGNGDLRHPVAGPDELVFLASGYPSETQITVVNTYNGYTRPVHKPEFYKDPWKQFRFEVQIVQPRSDWLLSLVAFNCSTYEFSIWDLKHGELQVWEKRSEISLSTLGLDLHHIESFSLSTGRSLSSPSGGTSMHTPSTREALLTLGAIVGGILSFVHTPTRSNDVNEFDGKIVWVAFQFL